MPSYSDMLSLFLDIGAKTGLSEIGIDEGLRAEVLPISAAIRTRLTLVRMCRVLSFED